LPAGGDRSGCDPSYLASFPFFRVTGDVIFDFLLNPGRYVSVNLLFEEASTVIPCRAASAAGGAGSPSLPSLSAKDYKC